MSAALWGDNRGRVENCHNIGEVSGNQVGGVVGRNSGNVENCYNTVSVSGGMCVGGVVGVNSGNVENCYNIGEVSGMYVGGVVGYNDGNVENCYNTGKVSGTYVGGVVGLNDGGSVTGCYFLQQDGLSGGATGATAVNDLNDLCEALEDSGTWSISPFYKHPVLQENPEGGDGTAAHPYEIKTATQLETFRDIVNDENGQTADPDAHAKLMNNIDLSSVCSKEKGNWTPIGNDAHQYIGTFDGNGKTISGLYIAGDDDDQGLFGYLDQGGTVQNLSVSGTVNSSGDYVGGVAGDNSGTVTNCAFSGSVSGSWFVGGVVGYNYSGTVTGCIFSGSGSVTGVTGSSYYVGGVVGYSSGGASVTNCYNTGEVSGGEDVGGVVGYNISSTVENCYNTGNVSGGSKGGVVGYNAVTQLGGSSVTNCYFLKGTAESGIGKNEGSGDATATEKDNTAFHSGEVAWRLQAGQKAAGEEDPIPQVWGQSNLNTPDSWPTLVALDKDENAKPVYKVVFISDNTEIEAQYANSGMTVGSPTTNPTKEGYTFAGWFTEDSGGSQWNFSTAVTENMTLYAQWTPVEEPDPTPTPTPDPEPSGPSTGDSTGWDDIRDELGNAAKGDEITIDMGDETKVPAEVFETLAGQDITLEIALEGGVTWTVNGQDIPADANLDDLDLGVEMDSDGIPVDVVNSITGERDTVQMTLAHDGDFGFTMTLTAPLGAKNAGYWANLYHYDEDAEQLTFETAAEIDADGNAALPLSHASQYAIVIDTHSHATVDVSDLFIDIAPDAWYKDAVQYAYDNGLMTGVSATEFAPEATTTRAMIVSILARLEGVTTAQAAGFADVDDNDWYATAVNWAANVGVVNGYEDNTFQPNTAITREQLAAILMNYAAYKGEDVSNRADLTSYTDQPSTWAEETMSWAVAEGLISGVTADTLQPQGAATRAQVAAILQRFLSE